MISFRIEELLGFTLYYFIFILIIFSVLCNLLKWINDKQLIYFIAIILIFISAFRGSGLDKDYTTYINSFTIVKEPLEYFRHYNDWSYFEPLYYLLPSFFKTIGFPFYKTILFLLFAVLGVSAKSIGIKKLSDNVGLSLLFYFSFYFFLHEMTQIRIGIVSGGLLICSYFYYHKKWSYFWLTIILSFCFQYTAILILLIFLLNRERFSLLINLLLLLGSFICVLLRVNVIDEVLFTFNLPFTEKLMLTLKTLTTEENKLNAFNIPYLLSFLFTTWLFINHKKIRESNVYATLILKIQLVSFICFGLFSSVAVMAFRLYEFFGIVSIITITYFAYTMKNKILSYGFITIYSLALLINLLHVTKLIMPYQLIFFQD